MQNILMKIVSYDEETKMLTVAFASDTTKSNNPDDYPTVSFEVFKVWPGQTLDYILKEIARYGKQRLEHIIAEEQAAPTGEEEQTLKQLAGQTQTFAVEDLDRSAAISTDIHYV